MRQTLRKFTPSFALGSYHFILAFLSAVLYGFPSKNLKVIGVTGTNGKSTVVEMTSRILEQAGFKVASLSSINFKIGDSVKPNKLKMTMPGRFIIQKFFRESVRAGCQYAILEVTSEGIKQHRHRFINFEAAVFTNLTPEHIESHGGFENYKTAKGKLFSAAKNIHIVNIDDKYGEYFLQFPAKKKYLYQIKNQDAKCKIKMQNLKISEDMDGFSLNLKLPGLFNIYNGLAAICVGLSQGIDLSVAKMAVEDLQGIPGRMEEVVSEPFRVIVDYAFTPNALEQVYQELRSKKAKNAKMVCVLGACGGGRDKWKRPVLGEIAAKYCDDIIVTNEDPYDEDPAEIIEQVVKGAAGRAKKILDRRKAIRESLKAAKNGDVIIITGKGCESWICLAGGKKMPWDDRQAVKAELNALKLKKTA